MLRQFHRINQVRSLPRVHVPPVDSKCLPKTTKKYSSVPPPISPKEINHFAETRPPFSIRTLLVGSSVGLATPFYATAGVVVAWHRVLPKNPTLQAFITLGVGGGIGTFMCSNIGPFLANHSEMLLPFAVANGISSMFWYSLLEYHVGLEVMAGSVAALAASTGGDSKVWPLNSRFARACFRYGVPFGGPAVGVLTAISAGYLYPIMAQLMWSDELQMILGPPAGIGALQNNKSPSFSWMVDLHHMVLFPVSIPVGLLSGYGVHALLAPVLLGNSLREAATPKPWPYVALPLLGLLSAAGVFYFTKCGSYDAAALFWENIRTGETTEGWSGANNSEVIATGAKLFAFLRTFVDHVTNSFGETFYGTAYSNHTQLSIHHDNIQLENIPVVCSSFPFLLISKHEELHLLLDILIRSKYLTLKKMKSEILQQKNKNNLKNKPLGMNESPILHNNSHSLVRVVPNNNNTSSSQILDVNDEIKALNIIIGQYFVRHGGNSKNNFKEGSVSTLLQECDIILTSEAKAKQFEFNGEMSKFSSQNQTTLKLLNDLKERNSLLANHLDLLRQRFNDELGYSPHLDEVALHNLIEAERSRFGFWNWTFHFLTFNVFSK